MAGEKEKKKNQGNLKERPWIFSLKVNPCKTELIALSSALCKGVTDRTAWNHFPFKAFEA